MVVDNNSTDRTGEIARSLGAVVVFQGRKGYGAAYQAGLPAATGDVIATLDDEPDRNAARAAAIRRTLGSIARQAAMDPADGMGL